MRAIETITGRVVACSTATTSTPTRSSPSSSSSGSSAPGSASSCSSTGPRSPAGSCRSNPILVAGRNFGCGSSREHAAVGARGLRLPGDHRAELRRHLPLQLHQDRAAAGRARASRRARAIAEAGEAQVDLDGAGGPLAGGAGALRDRPRDQAPAAQRPRRHRADACTRRTRSPPTSATASVRARSRQRCDSDVGERDVRGLGRGHLRPRLGPAVRLGARAARAPHAVPGDEVVLDAGCGSGRVTARCSCELRSARPRVRASTSRPSMVAHARSRARRPRDRPVPGPGRARSCPSRSTRSSRTRPSTGSTTTTRCSPRCIAALKPGRAAGRPVRRARATSTRSGRSADEIASEEPFAPLTSPAGSVPWNYATARTRAARLERGRVHRGRVLARAQAVTPEDPALVHPDRCLVPPPRPAADELRDPGSSIACYTAARRAARARLRAAEHDAAAPVLPRTRSERPATMAPRVSCCPATGSAPRSPRPDPRRPGRAPAPTSTTRSTCSAAPRSTPTAPR